jgi:hypothetical protein
VTRNRFDNEFALLWAAGVRVSDLAAHYGCTPAAVRAYAQRQGYKRAVPVTRQRPGMTLSEYHELRLRIALEQSAAETRAALRWRAPAARETIKRLRQWCEWCEQRRGVR